MAIAKVAEPEVIVLTLSLSAAEAKELKAVTQNTFCGCVDEAIELREVRHAIWRALNLAGV